MLRLKNIRLRPKLITLFVLTGLIPLLIGGYFSTELATDALVEKSFQQLLTVQSVQKAQVEALVEHRLQDLNTLVQSKRLADLVSALDHYKQQSDQAPSGPFPVQSQAYNELVRKYIIFYRRFNATYGFRDLLLIEPKTGKVMFSVLQESDLGANLAYGRYRNSGLAAIWRKAYNSGQPEIVDFSPFVPSNGLECAFLGQPVINDAGKISCIVALQLAPNFITAGLDSRKGLGQTGESYFFSWDAADNHFELRSNLKTMGDGKLSVGYSDLTPPKYWLLATERGASGGHGIFGDTSGNKVLVAYSKLKLKDLNWYLVSKINKYEITAPVRKMVQQVGSIVTGLVLLIACCSLAFANSFTKPILGGVRFAQQISEGKLNQSLEINQKDELGDLARALNEMARNLYEINWLQRGKMGIEDEMRGEHDAEELAKRFISFMVTHTRSDLGAFYFHKDGVLRLTATYAYTDRTGNFDLIRVGEGMVGQAAYERKLLVFTNVPEDTPVINFGGGERKPDHFLIAPLVYDGNLLGAFFLGSLAPYKKLHKQFIERNLENSAIHFNISNSQQRIRELLESAQEQQLKLSIANSELEDKATELQKSKSELQAQQEELRVANEELQEQTRALKESEEELQSQQEELRVTNEELENRTQALEEQKKSMLQQNEELEKARQNLEQQARQLEVASKYKSEFLANMSHELRTPLNSILILSQLLAKNRDNNLNEKQVESANAIHSSGSDLLRLINEILDLSKVEAGKIELYFENSPLSELLSDLNRVFKDIADSKGIGFSVNLEEGLPDTIYTDAHRLQQILRNLLTNAFKFTHQGNVYLHISRPSAELCSFKGLDPAASIAFAVIDEGIGIPEEKQAAIFEAFQQADGSTSRTYGGTGLGLSISREFVKLLGGSIHLKSELKKGSVFTIVLPEKHVPEDGGQPPSPLPQQCKLDTPPVPSQPLALAEEPPEAYEPPEAQSEPAATAKPPEGADPVNDDRKCVKSEDKSLLIIEDDVHFAKVVRDFAKERGFKCLVAEDGETGLHFADYYLPSAILLDIGLPGIDGWAVMERLKENSKLRHIPVHFISANDSSLDALRMGAVGFLTKPVSMEAIEAALGKIESLITKPVRKLLVVEDDPVQRESIKQLIGNGDVETTLASSGAEAFEKLTSGAFDCMILDLGLSDMSGFELLDKLKDNENCSQVPVIIYTGRELSRDEEKELRKYADSIIIKGVKSPERLLDETALFLHRVEANMPQDKRNMLKSIHNKESVLQGKIILLVDDDMRNVFALSNVLEEKGMEVIIARNGQECLDKLHKSDSVDLILMDIMMPQMDGYEAMREIRKEQKYRQLPIIALTAKAMKGDRNKCIEAGANDYLAKPVNTDKLISMLRVWLYS